MKSQSGKPKKAQSTVSPSMLIQQPKFSRGQVIILALFLALFGVIVIFITHAAIASVASAEAESMTLPPGGSVIADTTASSGQAVKLVSNGAVTGSVNLPSSATSVSFRAKGTKCNGTWPHASLDINGGTVIAPTKVTSASWITYSAPVSLATGSHAIKIVYTNASGTCRPLYLDVVTFSSDAPPPAPAPAPTVSLTSSPSPVTSGTSSTLTWSSTNATSCSAFGAWTGSKTISGSQSTGALNTSSTYSLTCTGGGGSTSASTTVSVSAASLSKPVFAIYYIWWSNQHWHDRLGANYPYTQSPNPLPATLDAGGCSSTNSYTGNTLTDVSQTHGTQNLDYDVNLPGVIETDVRLAASRGLAGFSLNWKGDGTTTQTPTSGADNKRLQTMFDAVRKVNSEGIPFKLQLNYKASAVLLTPSYIINDMNYYISTYGADTAMDHTYSARPAVIWTGSWKYSDADVSAVSQAIRSRIYFIGDEKVASWDANAAANFDGNSYYWSSQDPYNNASSFTQVQSLAANVRSTKNPDGSNKIWLAPFTPGYNSQLLYPTSTCVPRNGGTTMHKLFDGNLASNPDGWTFISWNEIAEGTYVTPLTRYGNTYIDVLKTIIQTNQ